MIISIERAKKTVRTLPHILKKYAFWLISLHAVNFLFNQTMIYLQELRMTSQEDNYIAYMLIVAFVGFFVQSAVKVIWVFTICHSFNSQQKTLGEFIRSHLEQGLIESLRAFLKAIKWGFLFIVPGLIKAIRFQFVSFIVCTHKDYESGKVDALKTSESLTQKHLLGLAGLFIIFGALSMSTSSSHLFINKPLLVGFTEILSLILMTFELTYICFIFHDLNANKAFTVKG